MPDNPPTVVERKERLCGTSYWLNNLSRETAAADRVVWWVAEHAAAAAITKYRKAFLNLFSVFCLKITRAAAWVRRGQNPSCYDWHWDILYRSHKVFPLS